MKKKREIVVMGGSFDPPTSAHKMLMKEAVDTLVRTSASSCLSAHMKHAGDSTMKAIQKMLGAVLMDVHDWHKKQ